MAFSTERGPGNGAGDDYQPLTPTHRGGVPGAMRRLLLLLVVLVAAALVLTAYVPTGLSGIGDSPGALVTACLLYALLLAVPFVPSVEIGLLIMALFGPWGALGAYLATLLGLNLAFLMGRAIRVHGGLRGIRMIRTLEARLSDTLAHRRGSVITLALLLNLPGNTLVGGGGGVALVFGISGGLCWRDFALTVTAATAVLPALFVAGLFSATALLHN